MVDVLITVILLGLAASFSPVIIATTASQLTRTWPVARALAVVTGVAIATGLLELMALGLLAGLSALVSGGNDRAIRIAFDLGVGALLIWLAVRLLSGGHETKEVIVQPKLEADYGKDGRGLNRLFILGFTLMFLNAKSFLLITGAVTQIRVLNSWIEVAVLLIILYVIVNFFPSAPLIAYLISSTFGAKIPEFAAWSLEQGKPAVEKARSAKQWFFIDHRMAVKMLTLAGGALLLGRGIGLWIG